MEMARKSQKGKAPPRYDEAFKAGAIRLVTEGRRPAREVAQELGICIDTLRSWLRNAGVGTVRELGQASRAKELEAEVRALKKALAQREEEVEILKKSIGIVSKL